MSEMTANAALTAVANLPSQSAEMQVSVAVLNKAQDAMKQQGEAVMQLINAVPSATTEGTLGSNLNVTA